MDDRDIFDELIPQTETEVLNQMAAALHRRSFSTTKALIALETDLVRKRALTWDDFWQRQIERACSDVEAWEFLLDCVQRHRHKMPPVLTEWALDVANGLTKPKRGRGRPSEASRNRVVKQAIQLLYDNCVELTYEAACHAVGQRLHLSDDAVSEILWPRQRRRPRR